MSDKLRFTVLALPNAPWNELVRRFKLIEDLGFDLAGTGDHFVDWSNPPSPWFDAWTFLAAIARETSTIRIAPYVAQIPLRDPGMLARHALTLDHLSNGRLDVGLGIGLTIDPSYEMMGIPNWDNRERVARFKEYVEIVDQLLSNEVTSYEGKYYQINGAHMNPRPVQQPRPPILIAAMGPVMLKHTVRFADIWNSLSFAATFEEQLAETRERIATVDRLCSELGRDPATFEAFLSDVRPGCQNQRRFVSLLPVRGRLRRHGEPRGQARHIGRRPLLPDEGRAAADVREDRPRRDPAVENQPDTRQLAAGTVHHHV